MTTTRRELLEQLATSLNGPRLRRRRLIAEVEEHLRDAVAAEMANGANQEDALRAALARLGTAADISAQWNSDELRRRAARRRGYTAVALAVVAGGALGITQYASGKSSPAPSRCEGTMIRSSEDSTASAKPTHPSLRCKHTRQARR